MQITAIYPVISPMGAGVGETGTYFEISTGAAIPNLPSTEIINRVIRLTIRIVKINPSSKIINRVKSINHYY